MQEKSIKTAVVKGIEGIAKALLSCMPEIIEARRNDATPKRFSFALNTPQDTVFINSNACSCWYGIMLDTTRDYFGAGNGVPVLFVDFYGGCSNPRLIALPADMTDDEKVFLIKNELADLLETENDYREDWGGVVVQDQFYCELEEV